MIHKASINFDCPLFKPRIVKIAQLNFKRGEPGIRSVKLVDPSFFLGADFAFDRLQALERSQGKKRGATYLISSHAISAPRTNQPNDFVMLLSANI